MPFALASLMINSCNTGRNWCRGLTGLGLVDARISTEDIIVSLQENKRSHSAELQRNDGREWDSIAARH